MADRGVANVVEGRFSSSLHAFDDLALSLAWLAVFVVAVAADAPTSTPSAIVIAPRPARNPTVSGVT